MKQSIYFILLISMLQVGCSGAKEERDIPCVNIKYEDIVKPDIKLSELFNTYDFIIPERGNEKVIFGGITKIIGHKDRLVILDKDITNRIYVYDSAGKYIFSTVIGKGPREVIDIADFCIDDEHGNLLIMDNGNKAIKSFALGNGAFVGSFPLKDFFEGIEYASHNIVLLKSGAPQNDKPKLLFGNLANLNELSELPLYVNSTNAYRSHGSGNGFFIKTDSVIYYSEPYGTDVHMIAMAQVPYLRKKISLDFGDFSLTSHADKIQSADDLETYSQKSAYLSGLSNSTFGRNISYTVTNKNRFNYVIIDKNLQSATSYKKITNDLYKTPVLPFVGYSDAGAAYTYIPAEVMLTYSEQKLPINEKLKKKLGDNFDIMNSNPILVKLSNTSN